MTRAKRRYIEAAREAGCPRDQVENFLAMGYFATPKQLKFHALARACDDASGPKEIFFGGARGPGKTYATLAQCCDDCLRFPGLKVLFLRKIGKKAKESVDDIRRKLLRRTAHSFVDGTIAFLNGSRIVTGYFDHERDIEAYLGIEYDVIVIEEAGTIREAMHKMIVGSRRSSKPGWRTRSYLTSNPGGVAHQYLRKKFIMPERQGRPDPLYRCVLATVYDNPFVDAEYIQIELGQLTGWLRRAWLHGDWDIVAGQFFSNFREDLHVVRRTQAPIGRYKWIALDHGWTHPTAVALWTKHEGYSFVLDEYGGRGKLPEQHAAGIKAMLARHSMRVEDLDACVAGHDLFEKTQQRGNAIVTLADIYAEHGISFERAVTDRPQGAAQLLTLMGDVENGVAPRLFVSEVCKKTIEQFEAMVHDPHRPDDVLKVDWNEQDEGGDDYYDTNRYAAMRGAELGTLTTAGYAPVIGAPGYAAR